MTAPEQAEPQAKAKEHAGKKSVVNIFWSYASFFSTKVLNLVSILILARLLTPAEFGIMGLSVTVVGYFEILAGIGLGSALIAARDRVEETANAVFFFSLLLSTIMALALWASAAPIARFLGEPMLGQTLDVIALTVFVTGLPVVHDSFLQKELRFKQKLMPEVARGLVKGFVSIGLALLGFGVWSLIYGFLAGTIAFAVVAMIVRPWWPTALPRRDVTVRAFSYGTSMFVAQLVNLVPQTLDNILVGKWLGASALGIYSLAYRIPELVIKTFSAVALRVVFPIMAELQTSPEELRRHYYGYLRYFALLSLPCGAGIAMLSDPMVRVLYSPKWLGMVTPMQYLSIAFAIWTLRLLPGALYKAINRTDVMLRVSLMNLPIFVIGIVVAVPYGIDMVARAQVAIAILSCIPGYSILRSVIGIEGGKSLRALFPGVAAAVLTGAAAWAGQALVDGPPILELVAGLAAGGIAYLVSARLLAPEVFAAASQMVGARLARKLRLT